MHPIITIGIVLFSVAITFGLALLGFRRRKAPGAISFSSLMMLISVWSVVSLVIFLMPRSQEFIFFIKLKYFCIAFVPVAWFVYAIGFTGRTISMRWLAVLFFLPVLVQVVHWMGQGTWNAEPSLVKWFYLHASYSFLLAFAGTVLMLFSILGSASLHRWQTIPLLIGAVSPITLNLLYTFNILPMIGLDFSFLAFTVFGLAFAWSMFRYDLLKLVPVAREMLFDKMSDGLVVVDDHPKRHVLDMNPAARDHFDVTLDQVLGNPVAQIIPPLADSLPDRQAQNDAGSSLADAPKDFSLELEIGAKSFDVLVSSITKSRGRLGGYLIVLRDVTDRRASQLALSQASIREAELKAETAEAHAQAMEAEHKRKTQELEEARNLQLSMLPQKIPDLAWVDVAVSMETANEVGGDYYDFYSSDPHKLFVAVGDATGHGLRAGTMVTMTKALFNFEMPIADPIEFFRRCTKTMKTQSVGNLYMSLTLMELTKKRLVVTSAGMPPICVLRNGHTHEITNKGLPLGADPDFPYKTNSFDLDADDLIVLYTDGFPELFNEEEQMMGYGSVAELVETFPDLSPSELVNCFHNKAKDWLGNSVQTDDMTFVVLKIVGT